MSVTTQSPTTRIFNNKDLPQVKGKFVKFKVCAELYIDFPTKKRPEHMVNNIESMLTKGMADMEIAAECLSTGNLFNSAWKVQRSDTESAPPQLLDTNTEWDIADKLRKRVGDNKWLNQMSSAEMKIEIYKEAAKMRKRKGKK